MFSGDGYDAGAISFVANEVKREGSVVRLMSAQDAVAISNDLYKNGLRDFTAVIDAQRSLLALEEALVISRGQITVNLIALYKALGGGIVGI